MQDSDQWSYMKNVFTDAEIAIVKIKLITIWEYCKYSIFMINITEISEVLS